MRNKLIATSLIACLGFVATACTGPEEPKDPPILKVTSPQRSLVQSGTAPVLVTGTVTPNEHGHAIEKVLVNNVQANLNSDGTFQALVEIQPGATILETVARDVNGGEAKDARAIQAGDLRSAGSNIERAIGAAISADSFQKISLMASNMVKGLNIGEMLKPHQPMLRSGDPNGPDCLYIQGWIHDVKFSDFVLSLVPVDGGLEFRAEVKDLDVPGWARYAFSCADGSSNFRVTATRIAVGAKLVVTPDGANGFKTRLDNEDVRIEGLNVEADGMPGEVEDMVDWESKMQGIIAKAAEMFMEPAMNKAMGGLSGPKTLNVAGHNATMEFAPSLVDFDSTAGIMAMDMKFLISGAENAKFIYTDNGEPSMDPGNGFQIAIADDFANEMMAEAHALGIMKFGMPAHGGTFDNVDIAMSLPPMISADPTDGNMRIMLGDMILTFSQLGTPVGKAAMNAKVDLKIVEAANGYAVAIELGEPVFHVNVLDDIENATRFQDQDLSLLLETCLKAQVDSVSKLLVSVPLPAVGGLQMKNVSVGSDNGYVVINGSLE